VFRNLSAVVEAAGGRLADVFRLTIYVTDRSHIAAVAAVRSRHFSEPYPVSTALVVAGLGKAEWLLEVEATACL
jgi:enamine deaminase RidA (YjgF/YER057c/UK114 family)